MNITVNQIPEKWNPNEDAAFLKWMLKIKNVHYTQIK